MAELLHIYTNNPTKGGKDGTEVSSGTELAPISVLLDAGKGEQKAVKCAVRCESGFHIDGALTIKFVGDHADKWKVAMDNKSPPTILCRCLVLPPYPVLLTSIAVKQKAGGWIKKGTSK